MSKPRFDLELFWRLPRCTKVKNNGEGAYCAAGAAYKALGMKEIDEPYASLTGKTFYGKGLGFTYLNLPDGKEIFLNDAWSENDQGNFDKAKRMVIEAIKDHVEFTEDPLTFKIEEAASLKETVNV